VVYADKQTLVKPVPAKRTIALLTWRNAAVAAGVAAIIVFYFLKFNAGNVAEQNNYVKTNKVPDTIVKPVNNGQTTVVTNVPPTIQKNVIASRQSEQKDAVKEAKSTKREANAPAIAHQHMERYNKAAAIPDTEQPQMANSSERLDAIPVVNNKELPAKPQQRELAVIQAVPVAAIAVTETHTSFWDKLPLDEANKQEIMNIKNAGTAVAAVYDKVEEIKQQIHNTTVSVRIEKRKLIVSF